MRPLIRAFTLLGHPSGLRALAGSGAFGAASLASTRITLGTLVARFPPLRLQRQTLQDNQKNQREVPE
jgi:hypothetical protein